MINIIESAIITIIISFISGLLLEYYKNLSPRLLCNIGNGIPIEKNNKKICAYILTVRNISSKIIHDITLNVQGAHKNLEIKDAKITKGLKFDSSINDNILEVDIPFLDKEDEFSVTLYIESQYGMNNKPAVTIRSPEKFKEVDTIEQKGIIFSLFSIPKNRNNIVKKNEIIVPSEKDDFKKAMSKVPRTKTTINKRNRVISNRSRKTIKSKIGVIAIVSIILFTSGWGLGKLFFDVTPSNSDTPSVENNSNKQPTDATEPASVTTKNSSSKSSTGITNKNSVSKSSTNGTNKNSDTMTSIDPANGNTSGKSSTDGTTGNTDAKASIDATTKSSDIKPSTGGTTENADVKQSTDVTTRNTDANSTTGGTSGSTDAKTSTGGTTGNTNK
jgi:hypothetical protein